jgi:hypothetical protein
MSRWIDADQEKREAFEEILKQETSQSFSDTPLKEAMRKISEDHDIPIVVDGKALEEIGLSDEEPITIDRSNVSLRSLLRMMLREQDLTYMPMDEVLSITTIEKAEQNLLNRIYWLEGTGFAPDDKDSIIELIQTTIDREAWEAVGGHSSMQPLNQQRPAIVVSTTLGVHEKIEHLLQVCRDGHFGPAPAMKSVEVLAPPGGGGFGGGGGGNF